jgi:hypothetical protein
MEIKIHIAPDMELKFLKKIPWVQRDLSSVGYKTLHGFPVIIDPKLDPGEIKIYPENWKQLLQEQEERIEDAIKRFGDLKRKIEMTLC